jgi:hypothetical protein
LKAWQDLVAAKPLKVSSLMRSTATYLAGLMAQRKGGLAAEFTSAIPSRAWLTR